jgi:hypothetical protein
VRAPLDLDLQDQLMFGLTPARFGYLVGGVLGALTLGTRTPRPLAVPLALLSALLAAAFCWVRWQGRPLDAWLLDATIHAGRNFEVEIDPVLLRRIRAPLRRQSRRTIAVSALEPGAGSTTVATELGTALALKGRRVVLRESSAGSLASSRLRLDGTGRHALSGLTVCRKAGPEDECVILDLGTRLTAARVDLSLLVIGDDQGLDSPIPRRRQRSAHVEVISNRSAAPARAGRFAIPDDPAVGLAHAAQEPVILMFPSSRAAGAFHRLADAVDPSRPGPWHLGSSDVSPAG